eukprot:262932-Prorocentrum_minimum.AAC.2
MHQGPTFLTIQRVNDFNEFNEGLDATINVPRSVRSWNAPSVFSDSTLETGPHCPAVPGPGSV